nr:uncharacterized protein LOC111516986 [Leptinotarsa decemlineata]
MSGFNVKRRIRQTILEANRFLEEGNIYNAQRILQDIRECRKNLNRIRLQLSVQKFDLISRCLGELFSKISQTQSNGENSYAFSAQLSNTPGPGRPAINISRDQLEMLLSQGLTAKKMAKSFRCSVATIYKRCYEENLKFRFKYSTIIDEELKIIMGGLLEKHPNCGSVMMEGYLKSEGIILQRKRIRKILCEIDPIGTASRWSGTIKRRLYKVATPNSLWHMDAHMKLSRWGFVTHGCIDGYSRVIIYVSCTTSVTAETVINLFVPAVKKYGLPSRMRSDHGLENLFVAILMNSVRGLRRGSHITGRSVHNQRIERLWVDVFKQVINKFYDLFYEMENEGILDPDNVVHRFVLQKVYLSEINNNLKKLRNAWNNHKVRTENNRTPHEIWINGFLDNINSNHTAINELTNEQESLADRLQNIYEIQYGLNTTAISENVNFFSSNVNQLDLTTHHLMEVDNILEGNLSNIEKYKSCVNLLQSH